MHESECGTDFSPCLTNWLLHGERLWPTKFEHPIQDVARDQRFSFLRFGMTSTEPVTDDRLVSEEGVLNPGLSMIARPLLPPATTDLLDSHDRAITSRGEGASSSRYRCCLDRRKDDVGAARSNSIVNHNRVISCVRRKTCNVVLDSINEINSGLRVAFAPCVSASATINPDSSIPICSFFQARLPRPPYFAAAHSPSPTIERPVLSTI